MPYLELTLRRYVVALSLILRPNANLGQSSCCAHDLGREPRRAGHVFTVLLGAVPICTSIVLVGTCLARTGVAKIAMAVASCGATCLGAVILVLERLLGSDKSVLYDSWDMLAIHVGPSSVVQVLNSIGVEYPSVTVAHRRTREAILIDVLLQIGVLCVDDGGFVARLNHGPIVYVQTIGPGMVSSSITAIQTGVVVCCTLDCLGTGHASQEGLRVGLTRSRGVVKEVVGVVRWEVEAGGLF